jgi:hypothetical protein
LGITNYHAVNALEVGGAILGGATAGGMVGGPLGALSGAAVGAITWGSGKGITALANSGLGIKGPNDNWVYCEIG